MAKHKKLSKFATTNRAELIKQIECLYRITAKIRSKKATSQKDKKNYEKAVAYIKKAGFWPPYLIKVGDELIPRRIGPRGD